MALQLNLFGKLTPSRKVCPKPTNTYKEFVNAFVASESLCSNTLPQTEAKLCADDAWNTAGKGKDEHAVKKVLGTVFVAEESVNVGSFVKVLLKFPALATSGSSLSPSTDRSVSTTAASGTVSAGEPTLSSHSDGLLPDFLVAQIGLSVDTDIC